MLIVCTFLISLMSMFYGRIIQMRTWLSVHSMHPIMFPENRRETICSSVATNAWSRFKNSTNHYRVTTVTSTIPLCTDLHWSRWKKNWRSRRDNCFVSMTLPVPPWATLSVASIIEADLTFLIVGDWGRLLQRDILPSPIGRWQAQLPGLPMASVGRPLQHWKEAVLDMLEAVEPVPVLGVSEMSAVSIVPRATVFSLKARCTKVIRAKHFFQRIPSFLYLGKMTREENNNNMS